MAASERAARFATRLDVKLAHARPYRLLRILAAAVPVLARYAWLVARDRLGRRPSDADADAAWDAAHVAAARALHDLALDLAGALVKAAQIGGARADVLPRVFVDALGRFHDAVPPRPFETLRDQVQRDLGAPIEAHFARIDATALAAASLAQVHAATLRDGREVVVKIQYPEARRIIPLDLGMLRLTARMASWLRPNIDLQSLVFEVSRFIELELDFEREAASMARLRALLASDGDVVVPRSIPELCGERLIVMERLEGLPLTRCEELADHGHRPADVARKLGDLYGSMIFETGFFHGDPHPGNLLVLPDGRIGLLDFGLCKELPQDFARLSAQLIVCALIGDTAASLEAAAALGFDVEHVRAEHLRSLFLLMIGDEEDPHEGERRDSFFDIVGASRIRAIPEDFALVARTLVLLNGLSHRLAPGRRLVQAELLRHLAAGAAAAEREA